MPTSHKFVIRPATPADIDIIAGHRAAMFRDMGSAAPELTEAIVAATRGYLADAMPRGEYVGWLATSAGEPHSVVAGAGVQLRRVLPFPRRAPSPPGVAAGRQGIVVNVYTEKRFRRRGVARQVMVAVLTWAWAQKLDSLVLHAAPEGRRLYESLGFVATNEMRYMNPEA
jgi:GNAT superfamily N-acetyltransferase